MKTQCSQKKKKKKKTFLTFCTYICLRKRNLFKTYCVWLWFNLNEYMVNWRLASCFGYWNLEPIHSFPQSFILPTRLCCLFLFIFSMSVLCMVLVCPCPHGVYLPAPSLSLGSLSQVLRFSLSGSFPCPAAASLGCPLVASVLTSFKVAQVL